MPKTDNIEFPASKHDVVVIGAGFSGTLTALELAKEFKVLLVEAGPGVINRQGSSFNECYKLHSGVHYIGDLETAKKCLKGSIEFYRKFPDFILGSESDPWRNGQHFLMSNSLTERGEALSRIALLVKYYEELVEDDIENKVFGEPGEFVKYLSKDEYPNISDQILFEEEDGSKNPVNVVQGIQTKEAQIDIDRFSEHLAAEVAQNPNITTVFNHRVKHVGFQDGGFGYDIEAVDLGAKKTVTFDTKSVVNCAWQNAEYLNKQLGYYIPDGRIVRIKASILVKLTDELKQQNTCIFFNGPHCSFTNKGDGTAVVTYELATNLGYYDAGTDQLPEEIVEFYKNPPSLENRQGQELVRRILVGASKYLPALKAADVLELRHGHVKIIVREGEKYSLDKKDSPIHKRKEEGVEVNGLGFITHSGMKMTYTSRGAVRVKDVLREHLRLLGMLRERGKAVAQPLTQHRSAIVVKNLVCHGLRNFLIRDTEKARQELNENPAAMEDANTDLRKELRKGFELREKIFRRLSGDYSDSDTETGSTSSVLSGSDSPSLQRTNKL